jgi:hypothetical protein
MMMMMMMAMMMMMHMMMMMIDGDDDAHDDDDDHVDGDGARTFDDGCWNAEKDDKADGPLVAHAVADALPEDAAEPLLARHRRRGRLSRR